MSDREGFRHQAGGGDNLSIVRYGRDEMTQRELPNGTGGAVMPGEALTVGTDADDNPVFEYHDGNEETTVYVAVEARGRGMDAQTDEGYPADDAIIAVNPSGGGLNLRVAVGEALTDGTTLIPDASGTFIAESGEGWGFAFADETFDTSGLSDPALVASEVN